VKQFPTTLGMALAIAAVVACGSSDKDAASPTAGTAAAPTLIDPTVVLAESGRLMEATGSFHFLLDHQKGGTRLLPNLTLDEAEGDVVKPDKISAEFVGGSGGFVVKSSLITVGEDSYMTNPLTGRWETVPKDVSPLGFFDPQRGVSSMMTAVEDPVLKGSEEGVYLIEGELPAEALSPLVGLVLPGARVSVELTISVDTHYLQRATFGGAVKESELEGTIRTITLSGFGEPVNIEPPQ
jgi:hypothetical protein